MTGARVIGGPRLGTSRGPYVRKDPAVCELCNLLAPADAPACDWGRAVRRTADDYPCGNRAIMTATLGTVDRATRHPSGVVDLHLCTQHTAEMAATYATQPLEYRGAPR